ncbi:MAG: acyl-CoA dehydrogenase family protein [Planctomycetota bacterium]
MDFRLSTEQSLFQRTVREFAERTLQPRSREIDSAHQGIPEEIIQEMAGLGLFGVTIPEEYGGSAMPGEETVYATLTIHELARADLSMSVPVYALLCLGWSYLLARHGTEEAKREILPRVASGEWFLGIATTESGGGSDLANIKTVARHEGDRLIINGEKSYISGAEEATSRGGGHLTLFRTDPEAGHRGMTFAYVPAAAPGVSTTLFDDVGRGGLSTGAFRYQDVEIPARYVLGEINRGFYVNMEGFNAARTLVAAACMGGAERALEMGRDWVKQRVAFGRALANFEGISFEIADDRARLEMLRHFLIKSAWMIDRHYEDGSVTQREINEAVAVCKVTAPSLCLDVVKHALMYHGALGFTKDCPLEMAYRGVLSYLVGAEGGANIMRLIIAREFIGNEAIPYR